jgi:hypothetical protein
MSHAALASRPTTLKRKLKQPAVKIPPIVKTHWARPPPANENDLVWGGQAIADALGCSLERFYYLNNKGVFGDAVQRLGHKTLVASRSPLREVMFAK